MKCANLNNFKKIQHKNNNYVVKLLKILLQLKPLNTVHFPWIYKQKGQWWVRGKFCQNKASHYIQEKYPTHWVKDESKTRVSKYSCDWVCVVYLVASILTRKILLTKTVSNCLCAELYVFLLVVQWYQKCIYLVKFL